MQPPAVGIKVGHDFEGRDLHIERLGVLQVIIPNLVNNFAEEFGDATLGCLIVSVVVEARFVGGLGANTEDSRGVVDDVPVIGGGGKAGRT
jgi:hypothetical protein